MKDQNQWESASLEKKAKQENDLTSLESSGPKIPRGLRKCPHGCTKKHRQSQLLTAAPALQTRPWHFQLLISLITVQSWPAGAGLCRSSPADLQHWTVCSSFMDYAGTLLVSLFVTEEKKGFGSMQKNELLMVNPVQRSSSTDLLWTVPSGKMFGHCTPFHVFGPKKVWQGI